MAMYFVGMGLLLLLLKAFGPGAMGQWPWPWVLSPFGLAVVWWAWADATGYTKRREMDKMERRVEKRRREHLAALGMDVHGRREQNKSE